MTSTSGGNVLPGQHRQGGVDRVVGAPGARPMADDGFDPWSTEPTTTSCLYQIGVMSMVAVPAAPRVSTVPR